MARRPGHVSVRETAGTRPLRMAIDCPPGQRRTNGDDHACATRIFAGRHRLALATAHLAPASGGMIAVRDWWVTRARSARTDPSGGRLATAVPTATVLTKRKAF